MHVIGNKRFEMNSILFPMSIWQSIRSKYCLLKNIELLI